MGTVRRPKPARLAEKLRTIRTSLGLSQNGMLRHLGLAEDSFRSSISGYELGNREPPLPILLEYAQAAGVCVDVLINDDLNLPKKLRGVPVHHSVLSTPGSRRKPKR
ncbi:MAG: helix-turn-helix transcriptional regulator [Pyrinomonadaceae bacterium]